MKNIVLVGFMGTGKTAVGRRLAKLLGMKYASTDEMIEARERRSISEIFAADGEAYFRRVEKEVVKEVSGGQGAVIAAGGGAVLDDDNMAAMRRNGVVVCLSAAPEAILERTKTVANRPLLNVPSPIDKIRELLEKRAPYYAKADYTVDTTGKSVNQVAAEVLKIARDNE